MPLHEEEPLKEKPTEPTPKLETKTFIQKCRKIKENFTVEAVLACHVIPGVLVRLATQNLNLDKVCRVNKAYGKEICDALIARKGSYLEEELAVQQLIAGMEVWKNVLLTAIPSFLIVFLGAWSDKTGKRKICILLPIVGELLMCISNMINVYFFYELPAQVSVFSEAFFPAITGGWITTYMGVFSYISDVSSEETRTFRVGVANLCLTAGGPIGSALSGILLEKIGYYGVFALGTGIYLFSILYGFIYIKDPKRTLSNKDNEEPSKGLIHFLKTFFDTKHVKDTLVVAFKDGPNNRRTKSILIFTSIAFIYGPSYGEGTVKYLFTRYRFNWDALKYSYYSTFFICIHALGALISISLFSRRFQWDDSVLGIISNMSKIAGGITTGLARNGYQMYLGVLIEMFNATSFTALRSISSKLVTSDELGKMISIFNLTEVVTSMVFGPLYSWIYMMTLQFNASFFYYVSIILTVPPLMIFLWFFKQHRNSRKERRNGEQSELDENQTNKLNKDDPLMSSIDIADEKIFVQ